VIEVDLRRFPIFARLAQPELEAVAARLEVHELAPEQVVWREGEGAAGLVLLEQGALRIESRRDGALGRCEAPACFGAASLVGEGQRESSAVATGAGRALVLSRTAFARLVEDSPRAAARLLSAIAGDLSRLLREALPFVDQR
jgi:CRP-like cAMP-binding protein